MVSRDDVFRVLAGGVDLLVIGGGITGAGVALDAATRRYRVGLVERADFAAGTSSRSTRLVHGGIRYLPQGHLRLVRDALRERGRLLRLAPHLVHPLAFVVPLYAGARRPLGVRLPALARPLAPLGVRVGLTVYDLFARAPAFRHRRLSGDDLSRLAPDLRTAGLRSALLYYDARTDDVRLTHAVLATARAHGATTVNYAEVTALLRQGAAVRGAAVLDRLTGRTIEVPARAVVNATGIWAERVAALDGPPSFRIRHSKGVHLVLRPQAVAATAAIVIPETDDGRLAFLVPWGGRFVLGTTDEPYDGDLEAPVATAADVAYLLDHANRYLVRPLRPVDITATYAGVRPLIATAGGSTAALSRDHLVVTSPGGLVTVTGGKLTTYRKMAEDTVNVVAAREGTARPCRTAALPLAGAAGLDNARAALEAVALQPEQRAHLLETYGSLASEVAALVRDDPSLAAPLAQGLPHVAAEIVYACRAEQAVALADCLYLRTRLAVLDARAADAAAVCAARLMARVLGWDDAETARQLDAYRALRRRDDAALAAVPPAQAASP
ncbi:MAG: glycerol-3-phosphate dehydrogenase/oxidase [Armatimonadota bacterium]|nr:glycerol-3-phosphate dehydrogenase/oxidase [Armatimonadota bacterium]